MPKTWLPEALKTQAVAARSYALAVRKTTGAFDVYPDTRSQVYGGVSSEYPTTSAAVNATAGQVLTYNGKIATTYFFSTSGGRTAAIADVWKSAPVPYLVSVADPYDSLSPYHNWGPFTFTADKVQKALKVKGRLLDLQTTANASQRVDSVQAVGDQSERVVSGSELRTALGLRSTWFSVGVMALDPLTKATIAYGTPFKLTGLGRGLDDLRLEQRSPGTSDWTVNQDVAGAPDGSFSITIKAAAPEEYRVASGTIGTPSTSLVVAPRLSLKVTADLTGLKGTVRPSLPGIPVQVQQQNAAGRWATIAKATATRTGHFSVAPTAGLTACTAPASSPGTGGRSEHPQRSRSSDPRGHNRGRRCSRRAGAGGRRALRRRHRSRGVAAGCRQASARVRNREPRSGPSSRARRRGSEHSRRPARRGCPLGRMARLAQASPRVHTDRSARSEAVVPAAGPRVRLLAGATGQPSAR